MQVQLTIINHKSLQTQDVFITLFKCVIVSLFDYLITQINYYTKKSLKAALERITVSPVALTPNGEYPI